MRPLVTVLAAFVAMVPVVFSPVPASAQGPDVPPSPTPSDQPVAVPFLDWEVVSRRAHDVEAFTQGLVLTADGRLFESTGLYGGSTVREIDPASGDVLRRRTIPEGQFGEGLAMVDDELIQLTWKRGLARRFDAETFEILQRHHYEGQGWGLCFDGQRLVMSDGSDELEFRDPVTFELTGSVAVTVVGQPVHRLNELECVDGDVWANVWKTDAIVRIDPSDGCVTGVLDLSGIIEPHPAEEDGSSVLNGIAYDATADTFLVTGKRWPELIEIRLLDGVRRVDAAASE